MNLLMRLFIIQGAAKPISIKAKHEKIEGPQEIIGEKLYLYDLNFQMRS